MKNRICDLLGIEYPVIQGGMAWVATAELAAAVSNGGGLGLIAAGGNILIGHELLDFSHGTGPSHLFHYSSSSIIMP